MRSSTLTIQRVGGPLAIGSFELAGERREAVVFRPNCPRAPDLSDAGLAPGAFYEIILRGADGLGPTLAAEDGEPLALSASTIFATPSAGDPEVFDDLAPGPPRPRVRDAHSGARDASYVELGGASDVRAYFERSGDEIELDPPQRLPLNLFNDSATRVAFVIALDQTIDPSSENLARVRLEFRGESGPWRPLGAGVEVEELCGARGSTLRIEPRGVLPPDSRVRVVLAAGFADRRGHARMHDADDFAVVRSSEAPTPLADAVVEEFDDAERADFEFAGGDSTAVWAHGALSSSFGLPGTSEPGGPDGEFDWRVPAGSTLWLDTTLARITGGPGFLPTTERTIEGGVIDARHVHIEAGATVRVQGPNPLVILATGDVTIDGRIDVSGFSALGAIRSHTYMFGGRPLLEPGGHGAAGGGRGGDGHPDGFGFSSQGAAGSGAFDVSALGGRGGETGWSVSYDMDDRRGAGGGGGRFGPDAPNTTTGAGSFDQRRIGLDAESGFDALETDNGAIYGAGPARGGAIAPSPFADGDPANDFFGAAIDGASGARIDGELQRPWAGSGGGGGGDAVVSPGGMWPPSGSSYAGQGEFAGGGGGGGGAVRIVALGEIRFGSSGSIRARGGSGAGGVSSLFINRVGGAGGGGAGGHVILESARRVVFAGNASAQPQILATGGQGGAGKANVGGAYRGANGVVETLPKDDACPPGYATTGANPCRGHVHGAGGDSGPGLVQIHVPNGLADVALPSGATLADVSAPPALCEWGTTRLVPSVSFASRGRSEWIALGRGGFDPTSGGDTRPAFWFDGIEPSDGRVTTNARAVALAPPIYGPLPLASAPSTPNVCGGGWALAIDASAWHSSGLGYLLANPWLLRGAVVAAHSIGGSIATRFEVVAVDLAGGSRLRLWVDGDGPRLGDIAVPGWSDVSIHPSWLDVATDGVRHALPDDSALYPRFQGTIADAGGAPDEGAASALTSDMDALSSYASAIGLDFLRFDVRFVVAPHVAPSGETRVPRLALDALRIPFRY